MSHAKFGVLGNRKIKPKDKTYEGLVQGERRWMLAEDRRMRMQGWCMRCKCCPCGCREQGSLFEERR